MIEKELFKTKSSYKSVGSSIMACILFGVAALYLHLKIDGGDTFVVILLMLSVLALLYLRKSKEIILTNKRLIINFLYLPTVEKYNLGDIVSLDEDNFELSASTSDYSEAILHRGKKVIIKFKGTEKALLLDSYEIQDYYILIRHIRKIAKRLEPDFVGDPIEFGRFEQRIYGRESFWWFGLLSVYVLAALTALILKLTHG